MPPRAPAAMAASVLACVLTALPGPMAARRQAQDVAPDTPSARFERWLDAEAERSLAAGARARAAASSSDGVRARAADTRRHVLEAMGGLPDQRSPLNARVTGRLEREGYRIEHLVFESLPDFVVTASLYVPANRRGPFPALLGTAGHSNAGKAEPVYQHAWISLARRGVIVLAYDPPGQGERLEYFDAASGTSRIGIGTREHTHAGQQCLLTGTSIARYMAWDGIRALDYLLTRPDVDPARLGVAGNSGGGTQAAWLGVVEPRLSAIDVSCYITSWRSLWDGPGPQDMEQVLPGFLARGLDFSDLIVAAAPRPYLVSSALRDFFPIEGARAAVAEARLGYESLGAGDRLGTAEYDDTHGWKQPLREAAYRWFHRWWHDAASGSGDEGHVAVEPAEVLRASPTGQVATSFRSRTVFDWNLARAQRLAAERQAVTPVRLRALLQVPDAPAATTARREASAPVDGLRTERLELAVEGGLALPARLIHPSGPPRGVVLVADGRAHPATEPRERRTREAARHWGRNGYLTLVVDVRGAGVFAPVRGEGGYPADYQMAARAWLLGTSVVGWQTRDLLAAMAWLDREVPAPGAERVLHVAGSTAPAGLFAAALRPVSAVWVEEGLTSYLDLARTRDYQAPARVFVPGVLEVTDLPEAMAMARPATVHLVRPVGADGRAVEDEVALRGRLGTGIPGNVRLEATLGGPPASKP